MHRFLACFHNNLQKMTMIKNNKVFLMLDNQIFHTNKYQTSLLNNFKVFVYLNGKTDLRHWSNVIKNFPFLEIKRYKNNDIL